MCDTIFKSEDGKNYFGKNSDRSPNEAHLAVRVAAKDYGENETLKATYISLPQVRHTFECVLLKPYWIWGAEMGWNEYGLNIGNEALFTNVKRTKQDGLIGMDLLRIALERCKTPEEAAALIIELIERYGQEGNCGYGKKFFYDNAFLIASGKSALHIETAGKNWALKKVEDTYTISNCLSIRDNYDYCSKGFNGDFKQTYQNNLFTAVAGAETRKKLTYAKLCEKGEPIAKMTAALRLHSDESISINKSSTCSPCMHAGNMFGDQTTGSYVGEIDKLYFITGSSFPCLSIFKPVAPSAKVLPEDEKTALEFWLKREKLNRHIMSGNIDVEKYLDKAKKLENKYFTLALSANSEQESETVSKQCFEEEEILVSEFLASAGDKKIQIGGGLYFRKYWRKRNREMENEYKF